MRIPLANVVGKLNDGWRVAMATLSFERGTAFLSEQVRLTRMVDELIELARAPRSAASRPLPTRQRARSTTTRLARRLALPRAEVEALRSMTYRSVSRAARTGVPGAEASMIRLFFSELQQRVARLAMDILGPQILDWDAEGSVRRVGPARARRMRELGDPLAGRLRMTIGGGTKDIQRNIIGDRVLGLPR